MAELLRRVHGAPVKRGMGSPNYNPDRAKQVHALGNKALRAQGKQHRWSKEQASENGKKGGARSAELRAAARERTTTEQPTA
jgi:general stress protein YciG